MFLVKIFIAAVINFIINAAMGWGLDGWKFNWIYDLKPTACWKDDMDMASFMAVDFGMQIIFAFCFWLIVKGIPAPSKAGKGMLFGIITWLIGMAPGMSATYFFMNVHPTVVVFWSITGFISLNITGIVCGVVIGDRKKAKKE